jgi:hypothetical protein
MNLAALYIFAAVLWIGVIGGLYCDRLDYSIAAMILIILISVRIELAKRIERGLIHDREKGADEV